MHRRSFFHRGVWAFVVGVFSVMSFGQTATPAGKVSPAEVTQWLTQGEGDFAAGNLDQAKEAFEKAFAADPRNAQAGRDLAVLYLRQDKVKDAGHPLDVAATAKTLDRSTVMALAYQYIALKSPMQGVKPVLNYLNAHATKPDEGLLNAMAIALAAADARGIHSSFYTDSSRAYKKLNAKLEATRPGEKRWGVEWMPAADVDAKQKTVDAARVTINSDTKQIGSCDSQIAALQRLRDAVVYTEGENNQTAKKAAYQRQIDQLDAQRAQATKEIDTNQKTLTDTLPKWPDNVPIESLTLPSAGGA
jgi:tetratricopeptide (TPR) repeat protein